MGREGLALRWTSGVTSLSSAGMWVDLLYEGLHLQYPALKPCLDQKQTSITVEQNGVMKVVCGLTFHVSGHFGGITREYVLLQKHL